MPVRYRQERLLFAFFCEGLSCLECFYYGFYFVGAMTDRGLGWIGHGGFSGDRAEDLAGDQNISVDALFSEAIRPLAIAVEAAARGIGGHGRAHLLLRPSPESFRLRHGAMKLASGQGFRRIQPWADGDPWIDDDLLDSMKRELLRAYGVLAWEQAPSE
jgi:hypothetical protein